MTINLSLEQRVARLEGRVGWLVPEKEYFSDRQCIQVAILAVLALVILYFGTGVPNHYYQIVFSLVFCLLGYHRNFLLWPAKMFHWGLSVLNVVLLSFVLKIFIGGGTVRPFSWIMYPGFKAVSKAKGEGWLDSLVPETGWNIVWQQSEIATTVIDISIIQTFLMVLIIFSAFFTLEIIASLLSILLVLLSIPTLLSFNWDFVVMGMLFAAAVFYLQLAEGEAGVLEDTLAD